MDCVAVRNSDLGTKTFSDWSSFLLAHSLRQKMVRQDFERTYNHGAQREGLPHTLYLDFLHQFVSSIENESIVLVQETGAEECL